MNDPQGSRATEPGVLELPASTALPQVGEIVEATSRDGQAVCLVLLETGELAAFEPRCPHRGVPLCRGTLEGGLVICLDHFWRWHACSGEAAGGGHPALRTYRVEREGEGLRLLPP
ncbi:Rieske (2Fe-2S) protein [Vulcanococcus limneticus]|uniref:Rieske (2Fe-2S) protein n=1 Tax=Vulcanococcus limneticus TaxID=2170428 RepID=UPI00398C0532